MDAVVSLHDVTKTYYSRAASVRAIDRVSIDIRKGEMVLLMGPSGSGKTTLLSIIGCILQPTSGSVQIGGREVAGLTERELPRIRLADIGFIFQSFNLFPNLTAGENVELAFELRATTGKKARCRAAELMEMVGLSDKYDVLPADLSGGQKQRVAIARALAGGPRIILADEPTAALDYSSAQSIMDHLRQHARAEGRAVLAVTHDHRLMDFADRVIQIEDGRVRESTAVPAGGLA
jgi:putative ABC transport system ATP-binding protein